MSVLLVTHPACRDHDAGTFHPERPERLDAAIDGVRAASVEVVETEARRASRDELSQVHDPNYIKGIKELCRRGRAQLDADTAVVVESWEAALRSAGAGLVAIEELRSGAADVAFLAVRPPGHHALRARAMGFCLFNNIAVAAASLVAAGERVAIVDWDVHHGNGTQDTFYGSSDVVYISIHESPFYPGTGSVAEAGSHGGEGYTVNIPLPAGTAGDVIGSASTRIVVPVLDEFRPDWVLVSAGYDAHRADPLAGLRWESDTYRALAKSIAPVVPAGRTMFFLEGGYDLEAIEESVSCTIAGAHQASTEANEWIGESPDESWWRLTSAIKGAARHWSAVQG